MVEKKFRTLRFVAGLIKVFAWIALVLGLISALGAIVAGVVGGIGSFGGLMEQTPLGDVMGAAGGGLLMGLAFGVGIALASVVYFVMLYAGAEAIGVVLSLEQNTRETAYFLRGEGRLPPPPPAM